MRAVVIARFGEPSELGHEEVPLPRPKQGEVLVKIRAAAVNRSDWLNVRGALPITTLPRVPGRDFAGTVVEGPPELLGREVWGTGGGDIGFTRDGSHAEYVALPQEAVVPKPAGLSLEEAAASGLAYLTAASALLGLGDLRGGEAVLVTGAAGGVGSAAVGIARWKGALAIGAIKDESERPAAENAGAEVIIDTSRGGVTEAVMAATGGRGADLVLDSVGEVLFDPCLNSLAREGRMIHISAVGKEHVSFDLLDFYRRGLKLFGLNTAMLDAPGNAAVLRGLLPGFEEGTLRAPPIAGRYPLEAAGEAYARVGSGEAAGRLLMVPGSGRGR